MRTILFFVSFIFFISCDKDDIPNNEEIEPKILSQITIQGKSFVNEEGEAIIPWGFNYDRNTSSLMEDHWAESDFWELFEDDFKEMRLLGANLVRLHLQFDKYMASPTEVNETAFSNLKRKIDLAEKYGLYLDLTGLARYRKSDAPAWLDALPEEARWNAQAKFWEEVARRFGDRQSIMVYNLMNEPTTPNKVETDWLFGDSFGGFFFVQRLALDPKGRNQEEIFSSWIAKMTEAIRMHDDNTLITIGFLPFPNIDNWAPYLDYVSVHIYPDSDDLPASKTLLENIQNSKPIVVEEISNLYANADQIGNFITDNQSLAQGWLGFYRGKDFDELGLSLKDQIQKKWLEMFVELNPN